MAVTQGDSDSSEIDLPHLNVAGPVVDHASGHALSMDQLEERKRAYQQEVGALYRPSLRQSSLVSRLLGFVGGSTWKMLGSLGTRIEAVPFKQASYYKPPLFRSKT